MMNPQYILKLTPINSSEDNVLELDPNLVCGWMSFKDGSIVYVNSRSQNTFSVQESIAEIRKQMQACFIGLL